MGGKSTGTFHWTPGLEEVTMSFLRTWFTAIVSPVRSFDALKSRPAPLWGFWAVLIRFAGTSLTSGVLGLLLGRKPFEPSYLTFLRTVRYYTA